MNLYLNKRFFIIIFVVLVVGLAGYGAVLGTVPFTGQPYSAAGEPYLGVGGDPSLLDMLIQNGVDLQQVNDLDLAEL